MKFIVEINFDEKAGLVNLRNHLGSALLDAYGQVTYMIADIPGHMHPQKGGKLVDVQVNHQHAGHMRMEQAPEDAPLTFNLSIRCTTAAFEEGNPLTEVERILTQSILPGVKHLEPNRPRKLADYNRNAIGSFGIYGKPLGSYASDARKLPPEPNSPPVR